MYNCNNKCFKIFLNSKSYNCSYSCNRSHPVLCSNRVEYVSSCNRSYHAPCSNRVEYVSSCCRDHPVSCCDRVEYVSSCCRDQPVSCCNREEYSPCYNRNHPSSYCNGGEYSPCYNKSNNQYNNVDHNYLPDNLPDPLYAQNFYLEHLMENFKEVYYVEGKANRFVIYDSMIYHRPDYFRVGEAPFRIVQNLHFEKN